MFCTAPSMILPYPSALSFFPSPHVHTELRELCSVCCSWPLTVPPLPAYWVLHTTWTEVAILRSQNCLRLLFSRGPLWMEGSVRQEVAVAS